MIILTLNTKLRPKGSIPIAVVGNKNSLKPRQLKALERLVQKKINPDEIISRELSRSIASLSAELNRQLGLLIHRSGRIETVIVGDFERIVIPALTGIGSAGGRLRGLRCIRTSLSGGTGVNDEDVMDMVCLRLDLFSVLTIKDKLPDLLHTIHLVPEYGTEKNKGWIKLEPVHPARQDISCLELIEAVETEFTRLRPVLEVDKGLDLALLVSVTTAGRDEAEESLAELGELARSAGVKVLDKVVQRRRKIHPRFIIGRGKLMDIMLISLQLGVNLLVFDQELTPSQVRSVTDHTDLRVIDRTQLILDIFAGRARSREGKLQIEMAQLKYMLPRLSERDDALSRLTGGIGARGPGETRLEIDRRRINDRITRLGGELKNVSRQRFNRRSRRRKKDIPVISLIGYTNAGKSTLLNTLTESDCKAEDLLFATLDPTSRRLRFPHDLEVIITDTVGFIRNLPADLFKAFASTFEELQEADLLLHVIDLSNPGWRVQVEVVEELLLELKLERIPCLRVFNKIDRLKSQGGSIPAGEEGVFVNAIDGQTLPPLLAMAGKLLALAEQQYTCNH